MSHFQDLTIHYDLVPQGDQGLKFKARWLASNGRECIHELMYRGAPESFGAAMMEEAQELVLGVVSDVESAIRRGRFRDFQETADGSGTIAD
jgi:hypothetical protein